MTYEEERTVTLWQVPTWVVPSVLAVVTVVVVLLVFAVHRRRSR